MYGYAINDPVNFIDPDGLVAGLVRWDPSRFSHPSAPYNTNPNYSPGVSYVNDYVVDALGGSSDFIGNYFDMRKAKTIGADKYFHCLANCQAAQRGSGGVAAAEWISEKREQWDILVKEDPLSACVADMFANAIGRRGAGGDSPCSEVCGQFRPRGLDLKY